MSRLPTGRKPLPDQWFIEKAKRMEEELKQYAVMIDVDGDYDAVDGLGYGPINDFQGGGLFGIGMTVGYLLIDLEYLHLFNDAFETVEDSNFTGFQFKLGFTF